MNRYNATTPRAAAGAAALAATVLVIGLSVIVPARMISAPADLRAAASTPVVLDRIEVCADRNPELVSAHSTDVPELSAHQL